MSYFIIDRPIIIGNVINVKNEIEHDCVCSITMYKNVYYLGWVLGDNFEEANIEEITRPKCFIQRTGIGIIKNEDKVLKIYAITGRDLYRDNFDFYRKILKDIKLNILKLSYPHSTYHICYVKEESISNDYVLKNLGFIKVDDDFSVQKIDKYLNFKLYTRSIFSDVKKQLDSGYISFWYDKTIQEMNKNYLYNSSDYYQFGSYSFLKKRILYYFDSEWCLWDSQWVHGIP